jgi:hypothetical protein
MAHGWRKTTIEYHNLNIGMISGQAYNLEKKTMYCYQIVQCLSGTRTVAT